MGRPLRLRGDARRDDVGHYPVHVRFSDVDVYGHVNNVKYFEYFMEARILFTARLWHGLTEEGTPVRMVTARTDVDYKVPILFRPEPYDAWSWLTHVGERSMVIESEIVRRRPPARAGPGRDGVRRPRDEPPAAATARASANGCSPLPAGSGSSKVLTMNCAAWVT